MKLYPSLLCIAVATIQSIAYATELENAPFSLRFPTALGHLSFYGDVSALSGASAASKWESSPNPANKAWGFPDDYDWRVSSNYNNLAFDNDTQLNFTTETAAIDAGAFGVLRLGLLQITSNEAPSWNYPWLPFAFEGNGVQLSWGKKLSKSFALGAEVGFVHSETGYRVPETIGYMFTPAFVFVPIKLPAFDFAHTDKDSYSFRVGGLWQPADKWFLGLYGDYVTGTAETAVKYSPFQTEPFRFSQTVQQWVVHPGVAYEFAENAMIHADYEAGWTLDKYQTLNVQRFAVGTDIPLAKFLYLRIGASEDVNNNFSWSTGIGFYPSKHVFIDVAFQNDAFPELKQEFGHSQTLNASISVQW